MPPRPSDVPLRVPSELVRKASPRPPPPDDVALRLAVTKRGLGLELAEPTRLGVIRVDELVASLPGLQFPLDLSGGVPRFRHRRGALARLSAVLLRDPLVELLARRMTGIFGGDHEPAVTVLPHGTGALIGVSWQERSVAFVTTWAPIGRDVRLVVHRARGSGLEETAQRTALRAMSQALRGVATRTGSVFRVDDAPSRIAREVLARAGARAPMTTDVVLGAMIVETEGFRLLAEIDGRDAAIDAEGAEAIETAEVLLLADDALVADDLDTARSRYLAALERAPHHEEIARRLADLDRSVGGLAEAALATLVTATPAMLAGGLGATLLMAVGDIDGARAAFERAAETEDYGPLAAMHLVAAADLADSPADRASLLARASARAPASPAVRWRRLDACLALGDLHGATAEAEHLEAAARGPLAKQETLLRAGKAFADRGAPARSVELYERALRYRPASEDALVALGEALAASSRPARAAEVLARALALAARRKIVRHDATLALARVLADGLSELPLSIARAKEIPPTARESTAARALEARCLARLGDRAAASLTYARVRDAVEQGRIVRADEAIAWLSEAAVFEEEERDDALSAKQHLGVALRLAPRDPALLSAFRRVARLTEKLVEKAAPKTPPNAAPPVVSAPIDDELRADTLAEKVRANPSDLEIVLELSQVLERLGRDLDLLALLSARVEEGDEDTRSLLLPMRRGVLLRLADTARREGRPGEADLYEQMARS